MATPRKHAVALLSGGLDSTTAIALALEAGFTIDLALTFDLGQRAANREIAHASQLALHFGIPHRILPLPWFQNLGRKGGLLATDSQLPHPTLADLNDDAFSHRSAKAVWVPNRNGIFIEIAAGMAEDLGADHVLVGFNLEEANTFPDNSVAYLESLTNSLSFSTANQVRIISPTAYMNKDEIVKQAIAVHVPLEKLWSCYDSGDNMCGRCESCMRLKRAFFANEVSFDGRFKDISLR